MPTVHARIFCALTAVLFVAPLALPQVNGGQQEAQSVQGEIESGEPVLEGYTVQLYDAARHATLVTSEVRPDGGFEFHQTPYGSYMVTVTNSRGDSVFQGNLTVGGVREPFVIHLPKIEKNQPGRGTVSVNQLQHPPARKAFDAARNAQKYSEAGDYPRAADWLQKAIAISPDYADAWINLGAQHLRMGLFQRSAEESRHAIELGGPTLITLCNLAYADSILGNQTEAIELASQAVHLKPDDAHAHYVLGVILYSSHLDDAAAVRHLQFAAPTVEGARVALAKMKR